MPRAGAWYPVVGEASNERLVLDVRGKKVAIQKKFLEVRPDRPKVFTVVIRSRETAASVLSTSHREIDRVYAVCPECTNRVSILHNQPVATCRECSFRGDVAWWETG